MVDKVLLLQPLPDGALEYATAEEYPESLESLSELSWETLRDPGEIKGQVDDEIIRGLLILPDELSRGGRFSPLLFLARGGFKWLQTLRKSLAGFRCFWTLSSAAGRAYSPVPLPILINPKAPGIKTISILLILCITGMLISGYIGTETDRLNREHSDLLSRIEILREQVALAGEDLEPPGTELGPLNEVRAVQGWASWLSANTLSSGSQVGIVEHFNTYWIPPLDLSNPTLPSGFEWTLRLRGVSAAGLHRLLGWLEDKDLKLSEIEMARSTNSVPAGTGDLPIVIKGTFALSNDGSIRQ